MTTATLDLDTLPLTQDQTTALDSIFQYLCDPLEKVFVLRGFSGCGKSTLVHMLLHRMHKYQKAIKLINPSATIYEPELTATTNKAAENLGRITGWPVGTIHSKLGLRVETDFKLNKTVLVPRRMDPPEGKLIFVDEASFMNGELLGYLFTRTRNCKFILIGDPAQLTPVGVSGIPPAFALKCPGAALTEVVRQKKPDGSSAALHPITAWAEQLRNTVMTGVWTPFQPDGFHIQRLSRQDFLDKAEEELARANWRYDDSKILAWTNKCVIGYNQFIRNMAKGDPELQVGDYAVCNSFVQSGKFGIKTDQTVLITSIGPEEEIHGVKGKRVGIDGIHSVFHPTSLADKNAAIKRCRAAGLFSHVAEMENEWIDLRAAYAQTIDKSQGSTYKSVFIDLDNIARCNDLERVARMLYVGPSRARDHVYLTGDLA